MKFQKGDTIQVKPGNTDPDTQVSIAGWSGRILSVDAEEQMLTVEWDSPTLLQMPDSYIRHSLDEGYDYCEYFIGMDDVESISPRDTVADVNKVREELDERYHDYEMYGDDPVPFSQVEREAFDQSMIMPQSERSWMDLLADKLRFPFQAIVMESSGRTRRGHVLKVFDLNDFDEMYGIIADCKNEDGNLINFPLCDLEAADKKSENYRWVRRYAVWFANR